MCRQNDLLPVVFRIAYNGAPSSSHTQRDKNVLSAATLVQLLYTTNYIQSQGYFSAKNHPKPSNGGCACIAQMKISN